MAEQQSKENERKKLDQELLRQRIAQDQKFYANEMQKQKKKACDAQDMQTFHKAQMVRTYTIIIDSSLNYCIG